MIQNNTYELECLNTKEIANLPDRIRAKFVNSLSGFKSANLIGTIDQKGASNLAIISSAFHLGANPALMGFIIRPDSATRHTLENLRSTRYCTFNHVNHDIVTNAHQTSARYPKEQSEFKATGLSEEYLQGFTAPFVKEARIKLALEMIREISLEENGVHLIISSISAAYFPKSALMNDGHLDIASAGTVTVSGLDSYHETSFIGRLSYAKTDQGLSWLDQHGDSQCPVD